MTSPGDCDRAGVLTSKTSRIASGTNCQSLCEPRTLTLISLPEDVRNVILSGVRSCYQVRFQAGAAAWLWRRRGLSAGRGRRSIPGCVNRRRVSGPDTQRAGGAQRRAGFSQNTPQVSYAYGTHDAVADERRLERVQRPLRPVDPVATRITAGDAEDCLPHRGV